MINVLIVEDDPMASQLLEVYIEKNENYNHVQTVESAMFAEAVCRMKSVDLVLMDVCTALNANGLEAAKSIKKSMPDIKIIIITSQPEYSFLDRAREAGVESFWYKNGAANELLMVMDRTVSGECVYPDNTPVIKLGEVTSEKLTDREVEVLREVVSGETDAAIAEKLHMSLRTVKQHIQSMREKTGFRNRTELAVKARESGLIIN
ncbi:MAG: response regulator transcription factor [Ruminococcaceae bacterium]|nr:response regulator transcription factor [Oscillospiraceae bacterium]